MAGIKIIGTGSYLPERVVSNEEFSRFVETSDEWIRTRTGIEQRHIALDEPCWFLGAKAAQAALENAGIGPEQVDMIIATSVTSDYGFPSTSCLIQDYIKATNAFSMDVRVACSGYAYSLDMARRYLATGDVQTVLVVGAETLSQLLNFEDRNTCVLFGDGAAACVVQRSEGKFASFLGCDAEGARHTYCKRPRRETPFGTPEAPFAEELFEAPEDNFIFMNGREVYKFATKVCPMAVEEACKRIGIVPADLKIIVPHQANIRIIETAAKNLGLELSHFYTNMNRYGNTSSASIGICLDELNRAGSLQKGDLVCVVGFGAGLTYGASIFEW